MSVQDTIRRWAKAEAERDRLQARLDRLDACERTGRDEDPGNIERNLLDRALQQAGEEITEAEIAFHRELGDHDRVAELESDRMHAELTAAEASHSLLADVRRARGEG